MKYIFQLHEQVEMSGVWEVDSMVNVVLIVLSPGFWEQRFQIVQQVHQNQQIQ